MRKFAMAGLIGFSLMLSGCVVTPKAPPVKETLPIRTVETEHMVPLAKDAAWDKILLHVSEQFDVTLMSKESGIIKAEQKKTVSLGNFDCIKSNPDRDGMTSPWVDTQLIVTVDMNSTGNTTKATAKLTAKTSNYGLGFYTYATCQSSGLYERGLWKAAK